ncbi:protoheme IX farnesyltransferase [Enemella evansiae]|uniref:Protoheme IX farnesyltransferase n=1 Tax=Enemella evansiae TaxID=2016499 RepID=A0A255GJB0_9ACTN|nr:protoheme IX farnesyltransferase [Enemella evansiae]OYN94740.1 protoheme IX farnesyltransferase [Enemella evansiae]OYO06989.1 protoheme IX farnesyltransferase [Enemella evansiae]OYO08484.1 protoheme IX farnesyltransferase [Enemella evansiae]OYO14626.1 protoheme IX farnesyltransferase [Enemella evansiae]
MAAAPADAVGVGVIQVAVSSAHVGFYPLPDGRRLHGTPRAYPGRLHRPEEGSVTHTDAHPVVSTAGSVESGSVPAATWRDVVKAYVALTKPRIVELLLVTTAPAMFLAARGVPHLALVFWTLIAGGLAAASANTFNCVLDRDIDEKMRRTRRRPMPRHQVSPRAGTIFGIVLGVAATLLFGFFVNWLSAVLALVANAFYVLVYTMWLKRSMSQNIVWGGIAGCFPPLIGWTAVTNSVALAPFVLFAIVFFWTPPHTWALAFRYRADYAAAEVPMLPVVMSAPRVAKRILIYSILMVATSISLWPIADTGWLYPAVAILGGAVFLIEAIGLLRRANAGALDAALKPMRLFHWSNSYLALIFLAAAIDPLIFH